MNYIMRYTRPAADSDYGWEHQSLPIGNGWLGANVFGIIDRDRVQITENSLQNPGNLGGLNNFAELYLYFDHKKGTNYERGVNLNDAVAYTRYTADGVHYEREYFASYPDRVLVIRLTASKAFSTRVELVVPYIKPYAKEEGDGGGKSGTVTYEGNRARLRGKMDYYNIRFAGELAIVTDGTVKAGDDGLTVEGARDVVILLTVGTNYELRPEVFLEENPKKKLRDFDPVETVEKYLNAALEKEYPGLYQRHLEDYRALFSRVDLELGEEDQTPTDKLLRQYARGKRSPYLEMLYFQFGRYLLISSSRKDTLPANLQGVWNVHDHSPWGSGYWHNINVQMNYWPAFVTNLAETFPAYAAFNEAFRPKAELLAEDYVRENAPESYKKGCCGWTVGTGVYPYSIEGPGGHSGPGTGGLTSKLFWDYYDFTRDRNVLRETAYPALKGMSEFLTKTVSDNGYGLYRAAFSASPEQTHEYVKGKGWQYYHTVGCAFDQQMIYENGRDYLNAAAALGKTDDPVYRTQSKQINGYHPVRIGGSGQVKEYEEENLYSEIGEYHHRHISQLVGLYPGTLINRNTPAWMDAAKFSLTERGDRTTGWALAHRLNAWARTGDGDRAYKLVQRLIGKRTTENLWDFHPPFQIDGNFGGTAGIAELLLQSHEGYIAILPALPKAWKNGNFHGLAARGAFDVAVSWRDGIATEIIITSKAGEKCRVYYPGIGAAVLEGSAVSEKETDLISFQTEPGKTYRITAIPQCACTPPPRGFTERDGRLTWKGEQGVTYRVYRSLGDAPDYALLAVTQEHSYRDREDLTGLPYVMYRLTAQRNGERESDGAVITVSGIDKRYMRKYRLWCVWQKCKALCWYGCCEMDRIVKNFIHKGGF